MSIDTRVFQLLFTETTTEPRATLTRVHTATWWDGAKLLFEGTVQHRMAIDHEWPDGETTSSVEPIFPASKATRRAVQRHDDFAAAAFSAACTDQFRG